MSDIKAKIIEAFSVLQQRDAAAKEDNWQFKVRAYKKVIEQLRATEKSVTKVEDLDDIDGVGVKMRKKVEEILATGQLQAAEKAKENMDLGPLEALKGVHGIGDAKAKELIEAGIKTIPQLRAAFAAKPSLLNKTQKTGLEYYDDIMKRIPRAELEKHEALLRAALPEGMDGVVVGSYRRGAETSGDIDVLLSMDEPEEIRTKAFHAYVKGLRDKGYMVEELSKGKQKNLSIVRLTPESVARRLDLLVIPVEQMPYALLYFTGSQEFNVEFRKQALKKGYTLNEHEMKLTGKVQAKAVPPLKTEEDVFAFLGIEYKGPKARTGSAAVKLLAPEPESSPKKKVWVEKVSKTTGKTYWWNRETKESRWHKPSSEGGSKPSSAEGGRRGTRRIKRTP
jgi:DNA polymerase/3'-5' exonuclease PolX